MKRVVHVLCIVILSAALFTPSVFADKHTAREVQQLIKTVESKLEKYRDSGADKTAGREISQIELHLKNSKAYLDDGDEDFAFYEASKADAYFLLIDAKRDLEKARKDFKASDR